MSLIKSPESVGAQPIDQIDIPKRYPAAYLKFIRYFQEQAYTPANLPPETERIVFDAASKLLMRMRMADEQGITDNKFTSRLEDDWRHIESGKTNRNSVSKVKSTIELVELIETGLRDLSIASTNEPFQLTGIPPSKND